MNAKFVKKSTLLSIVICLVLSLNFLSACSPVVDTGAMAEPTEAPKIEVPPEVTRARDQALAYLVQQRLNGAPPQGLVWTGVNKTLPGVAGGASFDFLSEGWIINVSYPVVEPSAVIYTVLVSSTASDFHWQGFVDAFGQVTVPSPEPTAPERLIYQNEAYRIAFTYPPDWSLTEYAAGQPSAEGYPASRVVELSYDHFNILVHLKFYWDKTIIGGGIAPGDVQQNGTTTLLQQEVERNLLVDQEKVKLIWYGGRFDDLELYIRVEDAADIDWAAVNIPGRIVTEVETMLGSFERTGEPILPPTDITPPPAPQPTQPPAACALSPRLSVSGWAQVTPGLPNVVRSAPGRGDNSVVLGEIQAGTVVRVLEDSVCADGYHWWRVDAGLVTGWTAEGIDGVYWLAPMTEKTSLPVDGWVGTLVSTPDLPQVDDYFQMLDQGGSRYGIHALDPELCRQLEETRDTGMLVRVWGTLYFGRMDAYNTQIEVAQFEIYTPG